MSESERTAILIRIATPIVNSLISNTANTVKVTNLLIDFEVFELSEIFDFLQDHEQLKAKITEALDLLENN